jgi:hypothetical protein
MQFSAWQWQYAHSGNRYTQAYHTHDLKVDPNACVYLHSGLGFFIVVFYQITLTVLIVVLAHHPELNGVPIVFLIASH